MMLPSRADALTGAAPIQFKPNAWLTIDRDTTTFVVGSAEMGQGVTTGLTTILCEELDLDPKKIRLELAGANPDWDMPGVPMQLTGGSMSVKMFYNPLRKAGAIARE